MERSCRVPALAGRDTLAHFGEDGVRPVQRCADDTASRNLPYTVHILHFVRARDVDESFEVGSRFRNAPPAKFAKARSRVARSAADHKERVRLVDLCRPFFEKRVPDPIFIATTEFNGARAHLRKAAEELTAGRYPDSVRESIHAALVYPYKLRNPRFIAG